MTCEMCPRRCGVKREEGERGFCAQGDVMSIARIALHPYEEPPISGKNGSGTVFFCGCPLRCVFCQNADISRGRVKGKEYTEHQLAKELLRLQDIGATNINLVTATHFTEPVAKTLSLVRDKLHIPVVYNTSGYERVESIERLDGLVDVYLPDLKYASGELAEKYSGAPDYPEVAIRAIEKMYSQVGRCVYDGEILTKGVVVRHLVLPGHRSDSAQALKRLAKAVPVKDILLSLMSQYTPDFALECEYKNLHRRVTRFEYDSVVEVARELGFEGFIQSRSSSVRDYTPSFD